MTQPTGAPGPIRVVLAEDHTLVREGTRHLLEDSGRIEVVAEAADGEQAVAAVEHDDPHVAILDIGLPRLNGIEVTRRIKASQPHVGVLILTVHDDDQYVFALLEAGAAGYLLKDVDGNELVHAVEAVHAGESVLHPAITHKVLARLVHDDTTPATVSDNPLTDREREVLELAARGLPNKDIAAALGLSIRTIEAHLSSVFHKLEVGSRREGLTAWDVAKKKDDWEKLAGKRVWFKVSIKSTNVPNTIASNRLLAEKIPYPIHLGITEAGTKWSGSLKSSVGLGTLLADGIGDTIRISLSTFHAEEEVKVAWEILKALHLRERGPVLIACPTCGRLQFDMDTVVAEIEQRLESYTEPVEVAVLGCAVNGIGEASHADFGITGAKNEGLIFAHGKPLRKVPQDDLVDALFEEIDKSIDRGAVAVDESKAAEGADWLAKIEEENAGELTPERIAQMEHAAAESEQADITAESGEPYLKPVTRRPLARTASIAASGPPGWPARSIALSITWVKPAARIAHNFPSSGPARVIVSIPK